MKFESKYFYVDGLQLWGFYQTYWAVDIRQELQFMVDWLDANPKRRKQNYERFIVNWLKREQRSVTARHRETSVGQGPSASMNAKAIERYKQREVIR